MRRKTPMGWLHEPDAASWEEKALVSPGSLRWRVRGCACSSLLQGEETVLGTSLSGHMLHKLLKGELSSNHAFERMGLEELVLMEDLHALRCCVDADGHPLTFPLHSYSVVFQIQTDRSFRIHFALKMLALPQGEPGIRINLSRNRGEFGQVRKGLQRRAITTGQGLIGTFVIVMTLKACSGLACLLQRAGTVNGQAFLLIGPVIALDKSILLRVLGITDINLYLQTLTAAYKCGGKITPLGTTHPARITI